MNVIAKFLPGKDNQALRAKIRAALRAENHPMCRTEALRVMRRATSRVALTTDGHAAIERLAAHGRFERNRYCQCEACRAFDASCNRPTGRIC